MKKLSILTPVIYELDVLQPKQYRLVVAAILDLLTDSAPHYAKRLAGSPCSRLSLGEYRVVYRADDECVQVVLFGKRNDDEVYRIAAWMR